MMKKNSEHGEHSKVFNRCRERLFYYIAYPFKIILGKKKNIEGIEHQSRGDEREGVTCTRSSLSREDMDMYCQKVVVYLKTSEVYKEPNISVAYVAKAIGVSGVVISQSINTLLEKNFFNLINGMRVEEIKRMLLDGCLNKYSIEQIARMCGFRSRSSFYLAFNKMEGMTPTEWLKKNKK